MISPPPSPSFLLFPHLSPTPDPISFTLDSHLSKQTFPALARRTPQPFNDELEPQPRFSFDRRTSPSPSLNPSTSSLNSDSEPIPSLQRAHIGSKFGSSARSDSSAASTSPTSVAPVSIFEVVQKKRSIMEEPEIILSLDLCKFHAEDRLPQDPFWRPRWEMANLHLALWNGLDQVYRHAPTIVGPEDRLAFSHFASAVVNSIDTHHDIEEEYYFPSLEVAISMQANLEQHASFDDGVRALKFYLRACIIDPSIYTSSTLIDIIDLFAVELATHFADELNTLDPDVLREHFTTKDLDRQGASLQKHIVKDYKRHLYTALPVLIINTPPGRSWPLFSPLIKRIVLPLVLGRKHKASWKYGKWPNQLNVFGSGRDVTPPPRGRLGTVPEEEGTRGSADNNKEMDGR